MEKYTAKLGPLGEPDETGIGGLPDVRNLDILDKDGVLVAASRVKDDIESVQLALELEGFVADGDWWNSECQVVRIPAPSVPSPPLPKEQTRGGLKSKKAREFTAFIGKPIERLQGSGSNQQVIKTREVAVKNNGMVIESFQAADDDNDIRAKLEEHGFLPGTRDGDTIKVTRAPMKGAQKGTLGCLGFFLVIFLFVIVSCTTSALGGDGPKRGEAKERDAIYACKSFVKKQLKSPSSAKFSSESASGSGSSWTSRGIVESQNSFGAMIQTRYSCTMNYAKSSETWTGVATLNQ